MIATETFQTLVRAQAKARGIDPHLVVVKHPIGGLNTEELAERIETASAGLNEALSL